MFFGVDIYNITLLTAEIHSSHSQISTLNQHLVTVVSNFPIDNSLQKQKWLIQRDTKVYTKQTDLHTRTQ